MIVICEECGKKYRVDPSKIKGSRARFTCKSCGHPVSVAKPDESPPEPSALPGAEVTGPESVPAAPAGDEKAAAPKGERRRKGLGLRGKMFILFLLVPLVLMAAAGALYLLQLDSLSRMFIEESSAIVAEMSERMIEENARSVAAQVAIHLREHPELQPQGYAADEQFQKIAVQKVGLTGYSALYQVPGADGVWRTWAHVNPKILGIDMSRLKESLGENFDGFWKIYTAVAGGKESRGYYQWRDSDGSLREKFMVCTPVANSPYVIASTTYLDEFTQPVNTLVSRARTNTGTIRNITIGILAATLVLIGLIVSLYGYRLTKRIKGLTEIADRISVGELDAEIDTSAGDEIGDLSESIARMQESVRLSIERLRRRR